RLRPAEADPDGQRALLRGRVGRPRVTGDIQPRDPQGAAGTGDVHERVQHRRGVLGRGLATVTAGLEPDGVDAAVDLRGAQDLLDLVLRVALGDVDRLATEAPGLRQPVRIQIPDDDDG